MITGNTINERGEEWPRMSSSSNSSASQPRGRSKSAFRACARNVADLEGPRERRIQSTCVVVSVGKNLGEPVQHRLPRTFEHCSATMPNTPLACSKLYRQSGSKATWARQGTSCWSNRERFHDNYTAFISLRVLRGLAQSIRTNDDRSSIDA